MSGAFSHSAPPARSSRELQPPEQRVAEGQAAVAARVPALREVEQVVAEDRQRHLPPAGGAEQQRAGLLERPADAAEELHRRVRRPQLLEIGAEVARVQRQRLERAPAGFAARHLRVVVRVRMRAQAHRGVRRRARPPSRARVRTKAQMRASGTLASESARTYWKASSGVSAWPPSRASCVAGIQMTPPEVAEVPPKSSLFSTTSVRAPCAAATTAAVSAAAPEPTTSTSVCDVPGCGLWQVRGSAAQGVAEWQRADAGRRWRPARATRW